MMANMEVDEHQLMCEFDHIERYALRNGLNKYEQETCYKLLNCGERESYKSWHFLIRMKQHNFININMLKSLRSNDLVDTVVININGSCTRVKGIIKFTRLVTHRELVELFVQSISNITYGNYGIYSIKSMRDYDRLMEECVD